MIKRMTELIFILFIYFFLYDKGGGRHQSLTGISAIRLHSVWCPLPTTMQNYSKA